MNRRFDHYDDSQFEGEEVNKGNLNSNCCQHTVDVMQKVFKPLGLVDAFRLVFGVFGVFDSFLESENKGTSFPSLHAPQTNKSVIIVVLAPLNEVTCRIHPDVLTC
jgi:hypothetical protein